MSNSFIGQIMLTGFNFAPRFWAQCSGQLLPINQNLALFSLLGTQYGGNGTTTFALPDMRSRTPVSFGNTTVIGQSAGAESVTLLSTQLPAHTHVVNGSTAAGDSRNPSGRVYGQTNAGAMHAVATPNVTLAPQSVATAGGNQAHSNLQPYTTVNFCIALSGIFPSRN